MDSIRRRYQKTNTRVMMVNNSVTLEDADCILDAVVEFPDLNAAFERIRPITNFRKDDDEARILYLCRRVEQGSREINGNVQGRMMKVITFSNAKYSTLEGHYFMRVIHS